MFSVILLGSQTCVRWERLFWVFRNWHWGTHISNKKIKVTIISCKTQSSTLYKRMATEMISNLHCHLHHHQKLSWYHISHSKSQWNLVHCARLSTKMKINQEFIDFNKFLRTSKIQQWWLTMKMPDIYWACFLKCI